MKKEHLTFTIALETHNESGEKLRTIISEFSHRTRTTQILDSLGFSFSQNALYRFFKETGFLLEKKPSEIEGLLNIRLGEFIYEPVIYIKRTNK